MVLLELMDYLQAAAAPSLMRTPGDVASQAVDVDLVSPDSLAHNAMADLFGKIALSF